MVGDLLGVLVVAGVDVRVRPEGLDDGLGEERQERQVHALPLGERRLRPGPQRGDPGDVDLVGLGQLRGGLQRLAGLLRGDLPDPVDLLRGAAQVRERGLRRGGFAAGGGRGAAAAGAGAAAASAAFLASAAASTSCLRMRPPTPVPLTVGEVDAVVGGELAHQRGDVRGAVAGSTRCGRDRLGPLGFGLRASGSGLGSGWLGLRPAPAPALARARLRLRFGLWALARVPVPARVGGRRRAGVADHGQLAADLDGVVLLGADLEQRAGDRARGSRCRPCRWRPRAAARRPRPVADRLEPAGDGALGDGLAQLGHRHRRRRHRRAAAAGRLRGGLRLGLGLAARARGSAAGFRLGSAAGSPRRRCRRPRRRRRSPRARHRPRRCRPPGRRSSSARPRPATGSRCRPCRWIPRAAARRLRPCRPPA